jgi:protein TonB
MTNVLEWTYEKRDPISYASAIVLVVMMALVIEFSWVTLTKDRDLEMSAFIEHPSEPEMIKPIEPVKKVIEKREPQKTIPELVAPKQVTSPFASEAPREVRHQESLTPVERPPVAQALVSAPPPVPAPPPSTTSVAGIYEAQLRAYLEKIKRYPTSREARLTRPQGAVRVWLEISRSGQLLGVGVMSSSGSNLLDGEAIKTLKTGSYPPIPEEAFVGESSHKFSATLSYTLDSQ